jgi:lysophospholipase L1-like esterase
MPRAWIYEQTHALAGRIAASGAKCVWVGPVYGAANSPYHKDDQRVQELSQFLSQSVAPCLYIDSTRFAQPGQWPTTDGQHLTPTGYKAWGQDIANAVAQMKGQLTQK